MASLISLDTCEISLYGGSSSSGPFNDIDNQNISSEICISAMLESDQFGLPKCFDEITSNHTPGDSSVFEKSNLSAHLLDVSKPCLENNTTHSTDPYFLHGMKASSKNALSSSDTLVVDSKAETVSDNYINNKKDDRSQLLELSANQNCVEHLKYLKTEEHFEEFLKVTDHRTVIARTGIKVRRHQGSCEFHCPECEKKFPDQFSIISHFTEHRNCKSFICTHCNLPLSTEAEARIHFKAHDTEESKSVINQSLGSFKILDTAGHGDLHECSECGKVFESIQTLSRHKQLHLITNEKIPSDICGSDCHEKFTAASLVESNVESPQFNKSCIKDSGTDFSATISKERCEHKWACQTCGKAFRSSKALKEHEVVHTGARDFPCTICGKAFGTAANMRVHLMTHSDQRPFACQTCGATFRQKDSLKVHVRKHTGERPFVCNVCEMAFDRNFTLKNHMLTHAEKSFVCFVCGKPFSTRGGLNNHERLHFKDTSQPKKERGPRAKSGSGDWICDECGKNYSTRSNLKIHKKSHEPTQTYHVCPVCSQSYKSRDSMEVHMRRHNEDRPFKCTMCSRSFYRNYTLKIHILTHTGEKPHCCPVQGCRKSFAQTSSLSYHVRNHNKRAERTLNPSGKRPYRKQKVAEGNFLGKGNADCTVNMVASSPLNHCKSGSGYTSSTQDLKHCGVSLMQQSITADIVDSGVESMMLDEISSMTHHMDHALPTVWNDGECVDMLGVAHVLHHTTLHSLNETQ